MATLHVRGVPEELYQALSERASERGSSITVETIRLLRRALALERAGQARLLEAIRAEREHVKPGTPTAAELIRADRER